MLLKACVLNFVQNDAERYINESQGIHSEDCIEIRRNISFSEQFKKICIRRNSRYEKRNQK